jgi:NADH-quinone oxidoreductase subunit I
MSCSFCVEFCPFDAIEMNHDYELAVFDRYPQLVYDMAELTVPVEYYAALWPLRDAEEAELRREAEEEERARNEARAKAEVERAAAAQAAAAAPAPAASGAPAAIAADASAPAAVDAEAAAKKARLEELKRQAAEKARQRKESGA